MRVHMRRGCKHMCERGGGDVNKQPGHAGPRRLDQRLDKESPANPDTIKAPLQTDLQ